MKLKTLLFATVSAALVGSAALAVDQATLDTITSDLVAQGYTRIEIKNMPNSVKVEAYGPNGKLERLYDATGNVTREEFDDSQAAGMQDDDSDDDFDDDDDADDDDSNDDDDSASSGNSGSGSSGSGANDDDDNDDDPSDDDDSDDSDDSSDDDDDGSDDDGDDD